MMFYRSEKILEVLVTLRELGFAVVGDQAKGASPDIIKPLKVKCVKTVFQKP